MGARRARRARRAHEPTLTPPCVRPSFAAAAAAAATAAPAGRFYVDARSAALRWDSSRLSDLLASGERAVDISRILSVTTGLATDLLRRKLGRGEVFAGHAERFFSLVTAERTIDLEAASAAQARVLVRAFAFLTRARSRPGGQMPR